MSQIRTKELDLYRKTRSKYSWDNEPIDRAPIRRMIKEGVDDILIAKEIECSVPLVSNERTGMGIYKIKRIDWSLYEHLLGNTTDRAIARKVGVSSATVMYQRRKRKIPPYDPTKNTGEE